MSNAPVLRRSAVAALYAGALLMLVPHIGALAGAPLLTHLGYWLVFLYGCALVVCGTLALVFPRERPPRHPEVFGNALEPGPPEIRLSGGPPQEPIMLVQVDAPAARLEAVRDVLLARGVVMVDERRGRTRGLLRGEAPLRRLLGVGPEIDRASRGSAQLWARPTRYEPFTSAPEPAVA